MPRGPTTKKRAIPLALSHKYKFYTNGGLTFDGSSLGSMNGTQITVSEGHPFHSRQGSLGDLGGEFSTTKRYIEGGAQNISIGPFPEPRNPSIKRSYVGYCRPYFPQDSSGNPVFPPAGSSIQADLDSMGATAIARCAPGNPPFNAVTAVSELLKDGLPSLVGSQLWKDRARKAKIAKAAGQDYLTGQFGWVPLVSDISSFANVMINADRILGQYERDAGKVVRRRYTFPTKRSSSTTTYVSNVHADIGADSEAFWGQGVVPTGKVLRTRETVQKTWFSGAFTYYLPIGYESRNELVRLAAEARALLGLSLTPDTLWELSPWSWAADWFSNAGDVIHNVSRFATGGLILRYGYLMEHTIVKDIYTLDKPGIFGVSSVAPVTLVTETKLRRQANPFGFGLTWEGLSSFQASILAALGITHGSR